MTLFPFMVAYLSMAILATAFLVEFVRRQYTRKSVQLAHLPSRRCAGPFCKELSTGPFCSYTCEFWDENLSVRFYSFIKGNDAGNGEAEC
jgi:hypothetical protein